MRSRTPAPPLPWDDAASKAAFPKPQTRRAKAGDQVDTRDLKHRKVHPDRDEAYKRWLRTQPCVIKGKTNKRTDVLHVCWHPDQVGPVIPSDPAHPSKAMSGRVKVSDSDCMPLCRHAHNEQEWKHERFDHDYGIDRFAIGAEHYARFQKERAR